MPPRFCFRESLPCVLTSGVDVVDAKPVVAGNQNDESMGNV